jgi:hypothetical protein
MSENPTHIFKNQKGFDKPLAQNRHAMSGYLQASSEAIAGCSERPDFSPAQPRRAKTRHSAGKAAASDQRSCFQARSFTVS